MSKTDAANRHRVWMLLWHARTSWLLSQAGISHLIIKGETWPPEAARSASTDVDVLVDPTQYESALSALARSGMTLALAGVSPFEVALHSTPMRATGGPEIDVHRSFPGLDRDPETTWRILANRSTRRDLGHQSVPVPDLTTHALIAAAAAARDGSGSVSAQTFLALNDCMDVAAVVQLAEDIGAAGTLRAGLHAIGLVARADELSLPAIPNRFAHTAIAARRIEDVLTQPWRIRMKVVAREFWPTTDFLERSAPDVSLIRARRNHLIKVVHQVPGALRQVLSVRLTNSSSCKSTE